MPRLRPRNRQGRCYELSYKFQERDDRYVGWRLNHGTIVSPIGDGKAMGHAWLHQGDKVYDAVINMVFDIDVYKLKYQAKVIASYSAEEALRTLHEAGGNYGPWL